MQKCLKVAPDKNSFHVRNCRSNFLIYAPNSCHTCDVYVCVCVGGCVFVFVRHVVMGVELYHFMCMH